MPSRTKPPLTAEENARLDECGRRWRRIVGRNIRRHRQGMDMSQATLARLAGVTTNHLGQVELGNRAPTLDYIARIAFALGISPTAFFDQ